MNGPRIRASLAITAALVISLGVICDANAQCQYATCQSEGAVSLPSDWDISLPFERGERVRIHSGYGPTNGSTLHCRAQDSYCANDWYALDLVLPDRGNSGKGRPVLAIADGTVIDAQFASGNWANYGRRVYLRHSVNGTEYTSMYAHLDSISVSDGQQVSKGDQLGTLGQSCLGADSCGSFSTPHLHFSIHRGSNFGGSGTGGSYGGKAVIPEPIDGYTGLSRGDDLESDNGDDAPDPPTECGIVIADQPVVIEEDGPCGVVVGSPADAATGSGGHSYTATLSNPSPNYGTGLIWEFAFAQPGNYDVSAFVPEGVDTRQADYKIQYAGGDSVHLLKDQSANLGRWLHLGRFDFDTATDQWLRLGDNYDDAQYSGETFGMDAVRVVPSAMCECDTAGAEVVVLTCPEGDVTAICDGCFAPTNELCESMDAPDMGNTPPTPDAGNGGNNPTGGDMGSSTPPDSGSGTGDDDEEGPSGGGLVTAKGGCGCAAVASSLPGTAVLVLLLGLLFAGRRRG